ncbi:hypothetical protein JB92DRAFT_2785803 [Gautieria morchelliformis]|nr:hypothetical protein JB92DRAFT_2785803 [Gautieria morchelliformis]
MSEGDTKVDENAAIPGYNHNILDPRINNDVHIARAAEHSMLPHELSNTPVSSEKQSLSMVREIAPRVKPWTPIPLRRWYAISLIIFMVLVAAGLQIALHFSIVQNGWKVPSEFAATTGIMHYVYTLPPVAVAMIIVALWAWTDVDIKRMQPYIDLAYGNAPASRTILLDYSNQHAALASVSAYRHSHYLVALSSFMVLAGLAIQPLAASLFTLKQIWWTSPSLNVTGSQSLGLDPNFGNLTAFSAAAGFVQASILYNATVPNFVHDIWAIADVQVPRNQVANGTMFANTTGVRSNSNCKAGESGSIVPFTNETGFTMSGTSNGCSVTIPTPSNSSLQYGVEVVTCPNSPPPDPFKPVVFWTLAQSSQSATPAFSLVYCTPTIELFNAAVSVALQSGNLLNATIASNFTQSSNLTDPNGLIQGRAMNGVAFDLSNADPFVQQRAQAARVGLTEALIQRALKAPGGVLNQIQSFGMIGLTEHTYHLYLSLVAKENYFVANTAPLVVGIKTVQPRLFMVGVTTHILTGALFAYAILGTAIHVMHYRTRELIVLPRNPGTLASAAAFTARSNVADVLDGHLNEVELSRVLRDKRFKIDKTTGRIVMEGEKGYGTDTPLLSPRAQNLNN